MNLNAWRAEREKNLPAWVDKQHDSKFSKSCQIRRLKGTTAKKCNYNNQDKDTGPNRSVCSYISL